MSEDEIEVKAGESGIAIRAKGTAASRLGHSIADLISPISNFTGLIGDEVRNLRVYRQAAFQKGLERTHEIAFENGIEVKPVSTKLLANWSEGVSMEDADEDESLIDLWAGLLANNFETENPNALIFIDILKKISRAHADYLQLLVDTQDNGSSRHRTAFWETELSLVSNSDLKLYIQSVLLDATKNTKEVKLNPRFVEKALSKKLQGYFNRTGLDLLRATSYDDVNKSDYISEDMIEVAVFENDYDSNDLPDDIIDPLVQLNIISRESLENFEVIEDIGVFVEYVKLSSFGIRFLRQCGVLPASYSLDDVDGIDFENLFNDQ